MISIVFSSRNHNQNCIDMINKTSYFKNNQIIEVTNQEFSSNDGLSKRYNSCWDKCTNDIIVFMHDDLILPKEWDLKVYESFKTNLEFGVLGVAGTAEMTKECRWWAANSKLAGAVYHTRDNGGTWYLSEFSKIHNEILPVVAIDGLFIAIDKNKVKCRFNEKFSKFHFYDISFCLDNKLQGVNIGVIGDLQIKHLSVGDIPEDWYVEKHKAEQTYANNLPMSIGVKLVKPKIAPKSLSKFIDIVVLTKDADDLLNGCLNSIIDKTESYRYTIRVGDTGSKSLKRTENIIANLRDKYKNKWGQELDILLIQLPKYHFAANNNHIVDKYCKNEHLLFLNNDVEFINDVISQMAQTLTNKDVGTVGARLVYADYSIQHGGMLFFRNGQGTIGASHIGIKSYYGSDSSTSKVIGNTGACLMITRNNFNLAGGFNEGFTECFEDVYLNFKMIVLGKFNYMSGGAVAYHYESVTRKKNPQRQQNEQRDWNNLMLPFVMANYNSLKNFIKNV